jgi:hypothetical protein
MLAVRTAMLILVGCIFLSPATQGTASVGTRPAAASAVTACAPDSYTGSFVARLPQAAKFLQFVRWKARPKIVLGETDRKVVEEVDLGPVVSPGRIMLSAPMWSTPSSIAATSRLRC